MTAPVAAQPNPIDRKNLGKLALFLLFYSALLFALLPKLSLWLDEVIDMMGSRGSLLDAIRWAGGNPGGVPLGYVAHWASFQLFGVSAFSARLPSALASIVGCIGIFVLARSLRFRYPLIPVIVFAAFPLQWRYALEARSYEIALCISIWTIVLFHSLIQKPAGWKFVAYGFLGICGMYTQPYSLFILAAQALWALLIPLVEKRFILPRLFATLAIVMLTFSGWYLYVAGWSHPLTGVDGSQATGWSSLALIAHELTGMGYPGMILMLLGIAAGFRSDRIRPNGRSLWLLYLITPILGVLVFDMAFGYFLAIRQMIFVLTPLVILFAWGVESLTEASPKLAFAVLTAFLAGALYENVALFSRPRENWQAAAIELQGEVKNGACIVFEPADFEAYFTFFLPQLSSSKCPAETPPQHSRVAIAVSPRHSAAALTQQESKLADNGLTRVTSLKPVLPAVEVFARR